MQCWFLDGLANSSRRGWYINICVKWRMGSIRYVWGRNRSQYPPLSISVTALILSHTTHFENLRLFWFLPQVSVQYLICFNGHDFISTATNVNASNNLCTYQCLKNLIHNSYSMTKNFTGSIKIELKSEEIEQRAHTETRITVHE